MRNFPLRLARKIQNALSVALLRLAPWMLVIWIVFGVIMWSNLATHDARNHAMSHTVFWNFWSKPLTTSIVTSTSYPWIYSCNVFSIFTGIGNARKLIKNWESIHKKPHFNFDWIKGCFLQFFRGQCILKLSDKLSQKWKWFWTLRCLDSVSGQPSANCCSMFGELREAWKQGWGRYFWMYLW